MFKCAPLVFVLYLNGRCLYMCFCCTNIFKMFRQFSFLFLITIFLGNVNGTTDQHSRIPLNSITCMLSMFFCKYSFCVILIAPLILNSNSSVYFHKVYWRIFIQNINMLFWRGFPFFSYYYYQYWFHPNINFLEFKLFLFSIYLPTAE